eukprot:scaffold1040_cov376-Prasinococcus_capsulatus_cf.AAC.4
MRWPDNTRRSHAACKKREAFLGETPLSGAAVGHVRNAHASPLGFAWGAGRRPRDALFIVV